MSSYNQKNFKDQMKLKTTNNANTRIDEFTHKISKQIAEFTTFNSVQKGIEIVANTHTKNEDAEKWLNDEILKENNNIDLELAGNIQD